MCSEEVNRDQRRKIIKKALLLLPNNISTFDCVLRNISESGALVELASTMNVPDSFRIKFDGAAKPLNADVVWRSGNRIGVRFANANAAGSQSGHVFPTTEAGSQPEVSLPATVERSKRQLTNARGQKRDVIWL